MDIRPATRTQEASWVGNPEAKLGKPDAKWAGNQVAASDDNTERELLGLPCRPAWAESMGVLESGTPVLAVADMAGNGYK